MSQGNGDWVCVFIFHFGEVKTNLSGHDASLDPNVAAVFDRIQKETLDAALVQNNLLESTYAWNCVWNPVASADYSILVRVPQTYL
jgi:hypothetical protein